MTSPWASANMENMADMHTPEEYTSALLLRGTARPSDLHATVPAADPARQDGDTPYPDLRLKNAVTTGLTERSDPSAWRVALLAGWPH